MYHPMELGLKITYQGLHQKVRSYHVPSMRQSTSYFSPTQ